MSLGGLHSYSDLPKLFDLRESAVDLVAHGRNHIVNRNHVLLVNQSFAPNFGIDFLTGLQVFADVVLRLCDAGKLFASVDVEPGLGLSEVGAALNL